MPAEVTTVQNAFLPRHRQAGFTLIEVMIVVAIIGILSMIAIPSYRDYITRGRIPDATSNLSTMAVRMEQAFQDSRSYQPTTANVCAINAAGTTSRFFDFTCATTSSTLFTLTATGKGGMTGFTFTIDQANTRATSAAPTGWPTSTSCWTTSKSGC